MTAIAPALLVTLLAAAPTRTVVLGSGDCRDPQLADTVVQLGDELARQGHVEVLADVDARARLGGAESHSAEEIERQLAAAQQDFYGGQGAKATAQLDTALQALEHQPPGAQRWQLYVKARLTQGLVRTRGHAPGEGTAEDAFRAVLRLEPSYELDADYFPPSTQKLFEKVRKELARAKKVRVVVTSVPAGAQVYVDGRPMGKTPAVLNLAPGRYQLLVGRDAALSLPREYELTSAQDVRIDLPFESAIDTTRALCLRSTGDDKARLDHAVKLASMLDVDEVVLLRLARPQFGAGWLSAVLLRVQGAEKLREGGLSVGTGGVTASGISELARFVETGQAGGSVRTSSGGDAAAADGAGIGDGAGTGAGAGANMGAGAATGAGAASSAGRGSGADNVAGRVPRAGVGAGPGAGDAPSSATSAARSTTGNATRTEAIGAQTTDSSSATLGSSDAGAARRSVPAGARSGVKDRDDSGVSASTPPGAWMRPTGYALCAAGGVALVAGVVLEVGVASDQAYVDDWTTRGSPAGDAKKARAALDRISQRQPLAIAGLGVGVAAAGAGVALLYLAPKADTATPTVAVLPTADGAAAVIAGRF